MKLDNATRTGVAAVVYDPDVPRPYEQYSAVRGTVG